MELTQRRNSDSWIAVAINGILARLRRVEEVTPTVYAPTTAKYITQEATSDLNAEQALGALTTGLVKNTTTAGVGVLSIAAATDLPDHTHAAGQGANIPASSVTGTASVVGHTHAASDVTGTAVVVTTLAALGTGLVKNTTGTGALSIAAATDLPDHTHAAGQGANIANTVVTGLGTMSTQNANNVSISGGTITGITDLAAADGGTGASSLAAAGIVTAVGTPYNATGQTSTLGDTTLLAAPTTGFYRVSAWVLVTTGGTTGDCIQLYVKSNNGVGARDDNVPWTIGGTWYNNFNSSNTFNGWGIWEMYAVSGTAIQFHTVVVNTGNGIFTLRVRLEYLGA